MPFLVLLLILFAPSFQSEISSKKVKCDTQKTKQACLENSSECSWEGTGCSNKGESPSGPNSTVVDTKSNSKITKRKFSSGKQNVLRKSNAVVLTESTCPTNFGPTLGTSLNDDYEILRCNYSSTSSPGFVPMTAGSGVTSLKVTECKFESLTGKNVISFIPLDVDVTLSYSIFDALSGYNGRVIALYSGNNASSKILTIDSCVFRSCGQSVSGGIKIIDASYYSVVVKDSRFYACVGGDGGIIFVGFNGAAQMVRIENNYFAGNTVSSSNMGIIYFGGIDNPTTKINPLLGNRFCGGTTNSIIYLFVTPFTSEDTTTFSGSCVGTVPSTLNCHVYDNTAGSCLMTSTLSACGSGEDQNNCNPDELTCSTLYIHPGALAKCTPYTAPANEEEEEEEEHSSDSASKLRALFPFIVSLCLLLARI